VWIVMNTPKITRTGRIHYSIITRTHLMVHGLFSCSLSEQDDVAEKTVPHSRAVRLGDETKPDKECENCQARYTKCNVLFLAI
jgi:hypothetical protein